MKQSGWPARWGGRAFEGRPPALALMLGLTLVIAFLPGVVLFLPNLLGS